MHDADPAVGVGNNFSSVIQKIMRGRSTLLILALIVVAITFAILNPRFVSVINITNIGLQMSINMIIAVAMTFVIVSGGLDLAVGSIGIMSGCLVGVMLGGTDIPIILVILIGLASGVAAGLINGVVIAKLGVPPFVTTLGMMNIARGVALIVTQGYIISGFPKAFNQIGIGFFLGIPFPVYVMVVIIIIGHILMAKTEFGLNTYAIGGNARAARLAGLKIDAVTIKIYVLSGLLSAVSGILLTARVISAQPALMSTTNLEVIAAVFVGGTSMGGGRGSIPQTIIGAVFMAILFNGLNLIGVGYEWQVVVIGIILIIAVALDMRSRRQEV
jgi:ribose transport system permease protein